MRVPVPTLGITVLSGRDIAPGDRGHSAPVVFVNEQFAKQFWAGDSPVGRRVRRRGSTGPWSTVVGLVRDVKHYRVDRDMLPGVYVSLAQTPVSVSGMTVLLRTRVDPMSLVEEARRAVREMDSTLPLFDLTTLTARLERSLELRETYSWLFGVFAAVALALAMGGTYGVLSYVVGHRTHEIGVRMAVGAERPQVLRLLLGRGTAVVGAGVVLGVGVALLSTRLLASLLFGVTPADPGTYVAVATAVVTAALLATLVPAWRGASLAPTVALRKE